MNLSNLALGRKGRGARFPEAIRPESTQDEFPESGGDFDIREYTADMRLGGGQDEILANFDNPPTWIRDVTYDKRIARMRGGNIAITRATEGPMKTLT